jgi:hypothetical protein
MAWIRDQVDPDAPDDTHIVLGIDRSVDAEIGDRVVGGVLGYGMEGDEGVFHLLPSDLYYEAARSDGVVTVNLFTTVALLASESTLKAEDFERAKAAGLIPQHVSPHGVLDDVPAEVEWVTVLTATIPFPDNAELPGPPIVVIDHEGVVGLDELLATIPEAGVHIVGPKPE